MLGAGRARTWEQRGSGPGMVDTTAETIDQIKKSLAALDAILTRLR